MLGILALCPCTLPCGLFLPCLRAVGQEEKGCLLLSQALLPWDEPLPGGGGGIWTDATTTGGEEWIYVLIFKRLLDIIN